MLRELDFRKNNVLGAERGDVIFYDWDNGADGFADHAMLVTDFSKGSNSSFRYPLFTGHSVSVKNQGWTWSGYRGGWIEEKLKGTKKDGSSNPARAYLLYITY